MRRRTCEAAAPARLYVQVPGQLRFLLAVRHRRSEHVEVAYDASGSRSPGFPGSAGHVVQSLGVPLTEVGGVRVHGRSAEFSYRPGDGDVLELLPVERPQPIPGTDAAHPPRFLLDVHLGALARRLRLVGIDAAYRNDASDDALLIRANDERRVLLTQDRGLLRRRALWLGGYVRGVGPRAQLADVLGRFAPPLAPWTRCMACNGTLEAVPEEDVAHLLEPGTRRTYDRFMRCASCGRPYWRGAHSGGRGGLEATVAEARTIARQAQLAQQEQAQHSRQAQQPYGQGDGDREENGNDR